ncbi:hypothetical protein K443DRAFT_8618 [Laccaria amethystina LaAM-08-1]|uniref:Cytochrome P450 n=1 Tax=Laccaria amethystina LaAM-08-1 TaxID=1095629 RepID=A0A0C9XTD7_9AGAR|nr:hypothetical protein K443DRAFT_8618 [Laccaria amethystina LaAM-08-1]
MRVADQDSLDGSELVGQVSPLVLVAVDTTSNALVRTLFILAQHQNIQEKLRLGITEARIKRGDPAYEELASLRYLDAVWGETLRLHPPFFYLIRTTSADTMMPLSSPIKGFNGQETSEVLIPKNTTITISALESSCNPD